MKISPGLPQLLAEGVNIEDAWLPTPYYMLKNPGIKYVVFVLFKILIMDCIFASNTRSASFASHAKSNDETYRILTYPSVKRFIIYCM